MSENNIDMARAEIINNSVHVMMTTHRVAAAAVRVRQMARGIRHSVARLVPNAFFVRSIIDPLKRGRVKMPFRQRVLGGSS